MMFDDDNPLHYTDEDLEPATRRLRLTPASKIQPRPIRWMMKPWIPLGGLTLLGGREGLGKSTLWADWAARASTGRLEGSDLDAGPIDVLVAAYEDSIEHTIVPRLIAAGADLDRVHFIETLTAEGVETTLTMPLDTRRLIDKATEVGARMIILDPLVSILPADVNSHVDAETRRALKPLRDLAEATDAVVLGLVHMNKGSSTDFLDRVIGSRAFVASARSVIGLVRDPDDERRLLILHAKNNVGQRSPEAIEASIETQVIHTTAGPAEVGVLRIHGTRTVDIGAVMSTPGDEAERDDLNEAGHWLLAYLADAGGEAERSEILQAARAAGFSQPQTTRARTRAGVTTYRTKQMHSRSIWVHPDNRQSAHSIHSEHSAQAWDDCAPTVETHSAHPIPTSRPSALSEPSALTGDLA